MALATRRVARKERYCDTCRQRIERGQTYIRHSLPPHTEPFYADGWSVLHTCGMTTDQCVRYWEVDSRELAKDPDLVIL